MKTDLSMEALGDADTHPGGPVRFGHTVYLSGNFSGAGRELLRVPSYLSAEDLHSRVSRLSVFPNPATTEISFSIPAHAPHTAHLVSPASTILRTYRNLRGPSAIIRVTDLPPGIYLLRLTDPATGATAGTARFVKR